jgi:pyruvate ferredoxin oxidoreductase beta subunit
MNEGKRIPLKQLAGREEPPLRAGNSLCPGCAESIIVNTVLMEKPKDMRLVVVLATGCLEVSTTSYPASFWSIPVVHGTFDTAASLASGAVEAYEFLRETGERNERVRFVVFSGDGATYDIGLQALSGMLERGHQVTFVCLNNEGYMNTGGQRSSASSHFADTTTVPRSVRAEHDPRGRKNIVDIVCAHGVPYVAQTVANTIKPHDLRDKARAALCTDGPSFLSVLAPCTRGWSFDASQTITLGDLAIETGYWPLLEVRNGVRTMGYVPDAGKERRPISDFIRAQRHFGHMSSDPLQVALMQAAVDREWSRVLAQAGL